jgi:hypothetical protein
MKGILALGTKVTMDGGYVIATAQLKGAHVYLGGDSVHRFWRPRTS